MTDTFTPKAAVSWNEIYRKCISLAPTTEMSEWKRIGPASTFESANSSHSFVRFRSDSWVASVLRNLDYEFVKSSHTIEPETLLSFASMQL